MLHKKGVSTDEAPFCYFYHFDNSNRPVIFSFLLNEIITASALFQVDSLPYNNLHKTIVPTAYFLNDIPLTFLYIHIIISLHI